MATPQLQRRQWKNLHSYKIVEGQAHLSNELKREQQAHDADHHADVKQVGTAIAGPQYPADTSQHQKATQHLMQCTQVASFQQTVGDNVNPCFVVSAVSGQLCITQLCFPGYFYRYHVFSVV